MVAPVPLVFMLAFGATTSVVARRKGRSPGRWFLGGLVVGLPALILASLAGPAGEPVRLRRPLVAAVLAVALIGSLALLSVAADLVG